LFAITALLIFLFYKHCFKKGEQYEQEAYHFKHFYLERNIVYQCILYDYLYLCLYTIQYYTYLMLGIVFRLFIIYYITFNSVHSQNFTKCQKTDSTVRQKKNSLKYLLKKNNKNKVFNQLFVCFNVLL